MYHVKEAGTTELMLVGQQPTVKFYHCWPGAWTAEVV